MPKRYLTTKMASVLCSVFGYGEGGQTSPASHCLLSGTLSQC